MRGIQRTFFVGLFLLSFLMTHAQEATGADLQAQLDAALAKISSLESRLASEQTALSNLRVKFVQEVSAREAKIAELSAAPVASNNGAQERLNRSLVRNAQLSARIRELEKSVAVVEPATEPASTVQADSNGMSERLAAEQKAVADLRIKLVQEVSAREDKLKVQQANYAALEQRLGVEQHALSALRVKYVQDIAALKDSAASAPVAPDCSAQSKALNSLITSLSGQNASLRAAANAVATEPATPVTTPVASRGGQLKALNSLISSLSNQNAQLRASARAAASAAPVAPVVSSNQGQLKSLNTLITSLSNQNSSLRSQIRQLQTPSAAATTAQGYTIKAGDTLSSIALDIYGDAERWRDIAAANNISDQGTITLNIGQVINIP